MLSDTEVTPKWKEKGKMNRHQVKLNRLVVPKDKDLCQICKQWERSQQSMGELSTLSNLK